MATLNKVYLQWVTYNGFLVVVASQLPHSHISQFRCLATVLQLWQFSISWSCNCNLQPSMYWFPTSKANWEAGRRFQMILTWLWEAATSWDSFSDDICQTCHYKLAWPHDTMPFTNIWHSKGQLQLWNTKWHQALLWYGLNTTVRVQLKEELQANLQLSRGQVQVVVFFMDINNIENSLRKRDMIDIPENKKILVTHKVSKLHCLLLLWIAFLSLWEFGLHSTIVNQQLSL